MSVSAKNRARILRLTTNATLVALFVVFSTLLSFKTPFFEVSLVSLPILLSAFYCGPVDALIVATLGSFLEQALSAYGLSATTPIWMAPVILQALCAGLLFHFLCRGKQAKPVLLVAIILLSELVLTFANTAALYLDGYIWQYSVTALHILLPGRLLNGGVRCVLSVIILPLALPALSRHLPVRAKD
jgi:ECF transporter S component (folate family)